MQKNRQLAAVFLIDESASLRTTDPQKQRVAAAKSALQTLAGLAEQDLGGGAKPRVDVTIAAFGEGFTVVDPWHGLSYQTLKAAKASVDQFAERDKAIDTDYYLALEGAQRELAQHVSTMDASSTPCRTVLWFTDGEYSINGKRYGASTTKSYAPDIKLGTLAAADQVMAKGRDLLCAPDGMADRMRTDGVVTIAVALASGIEKKDQDLLQAMATGKGGATSCGAKGTDNTGAYIAANDLGTLVASFDAVANVIGYGTQALPRPGLPICLSAPCPEGKFSFPVDPGMTRFHVLMQTGVPAASVQVLSPEGGASAMLQVTEEGEANLGSVKLRYAWVAPDVMTVDGFLPPTEIAKWMGTWALTVVAPSPPANNVTAGARLFYYGDVHARLAGSPGLSDKKDTTLAVQLGYDASGPLLTGELLDKAVTNMTATVVGNGGTPVTARVGALDKDSVPVMVPASKDWATGKPELSLTTSFTTRSGVVLRPLSDVYTLGDAGTAGGTGAPKEKKNSGGVPIVLVALGVLALALVGLLGFFGPRLLKRGRRGRRGEPIPGIELVGVGRYRLRVRYGRAVSLSYLDERGRDIPFRIAREMVSEPIVPSDGGRAAVVGALSIERQGERIVASCAGLKVVSSLNSNGSLENGGLVAYLPFDLRQGWVFVASGATRSAQAAPPDGGRYDTGRTTNLAGRTVNMAESNQGPADALLDGEIYLFAGPGADLGQLAQSAQSLLPALAHAIASSGP